MADKKIECAKVAVDAAAAEAINARDDDGRTALMYAVESENLAVVKALVDKGADVNVRDNCGRTALMLAAQRGDEAMVNVLIGAGMGGKGK